MDGNGGLTAGGLRGITVIDASDTVAGQFAGRLFADHGAEVTLVEPAEGSPLRTCEPVDPANGRSYLFSHLNGGKSSLRLEPDGPGLESVLLELGRASDILIVSDSALARRLAGRVPAIVADVTDFGDSGPYAHWIGSELIHQALSGTMYVSGEEHREPLYGVQHRASHAAGLYLYMAALAALHQRVATSTSIASLSVTIHEAAASMEQNFTAQWSYSRTNTPRGGAMRPRGIARCADGWLVYFIVPEHWERFCTAFGVPELIDDPRFATREDLTRNWADARVEISRCVKDLRVDEVAQTGIRHGLVLAPVMTLAAFADDEHLAARGFWTRLDDGSIALGPIFRFSRTASIRNRPAPTLGAGGQPQGSATRGRLAPAVGRPLEGIRVLDLTNAWAGPMAGRILGLLGADVVKVEGPARLDSWRFETTSPSYPDYYPDSDPGERPWNKSCWFNSQNHDKRSLVVDLKNPRGAELVTSLARHSDVVLANWSPGALARVGLGYEQLAADNPGVIVVEMPAAGNSGPLRDMRGYGPTMEAMAGMTGLIGYPDGTPTGTGSAYLDPTGALHGAAAILTALLHRDDTGEGQYIEVAQQEAAMHWIGDKVLDAVANGTVYQPAGNSIPGAAPHGAFPALGDDEWLAISVETDRQWVALCEVVGFAADPRFARFEGRKADEDELAASLGALTRTWDKRQLAHALQRAGVPAAPVTKGSDLHDDEQLRANAWFSTLPHPEVGLRDYPGLPFVFDGRRLQPRTVSPPFGQDNVEVLADVLGVAPEDARELESAGVTATRPRV